MTTEFAKEVAKYLKEKKLGFVFTTYGFISREYLTEAFGITFN